MKIIIALVITQSCILILEKPQRCHYIFNIKMTRRKPFENLEIQVKCLSFY